MIQINETTFIGSRHIVELEFSEDHGGHRLLNLVLSNGARYQVTGLWVGPVLVDLMVDRGGRAGGL